MTLESPGRALHRCCCQTSSPVYSPYLEGRDMLRKKKSLLYILDSSLPRKQPWPGIAGQSPSLEETDNKKGALRRNESAILHALTGPLIKICLAAECGGLLYCWRCKIPAVWLYHNSNMVKDKTRCQRVSVIRDKNSKFGMSSITLWVPSRFGALTIRNALFLVQEREEK